MIIVSHLLARVKSLVTTLFRRVLNRVNAMLNLVVYQLEFGNCGDRTT